MSKVVNISEAASLAIHAVVLIAASDKLINVNQIAEATGASKNHLAKVMQRLGKQGLVASSRGPNGGFKLKKKPNEFTLYDIYESIEGPIEIEGCPMERPVCPFDKCLMGGIIHKVTSDLRTYLEAETIDKYI
ncbi:MULTISPECIES: Rrf2 family transcriptional regulator [unclassified Lentimicrobium]|uniref:RrF2 family transcriptional regulator n=1 Tax=unclassified Lentimicrobium TaxID=2677434 RepID=UPI001551F6F2|nr:MULTISPECIES: Rrf2 family transcriptional regulator [unclassified Lentimicrobium]NPD46850.1 Rrf2 family transcriptional regulator [Lentimicrobium sp. S6]NPD84433.1 Rrf2 family transcriptional regulator [Lentimicrobium sp. L6]